MKRSWLLVCSVCLFTQVASPALAKRSTPGAAGTESASGARSARAPAAPKATAKPKAKPKQTAKLAKRRPKGPCYARPVQLVRVRGEQVEPRELSLTRCNGKPNLSVLEALSVLARPRDVARPTPAELRSYRARPIGKPGRRSKRKVRSPLFVTDSIMRVHPGLLLRLQRIANRYPGKIIEIISGYRPDARDTSRHHHGRALDLRVAGVSRERLRDFLRTFDETGVGYYPNSFFVHMDVREAKGYWVDRSGPGEPPDYGPWPRPGKKLDPARDAILREAFAQLAELGAPAARAPDQRTAMVERPGPNLREPEQEADDMSQDEIARVRAEARRALEQL